MLEFRTNNPSTKTAARSSSAGHLKARLDILLVSRAVFRIRVRSRILNQEGKPGRRRVYGALVHESLNPKSANRRDTHDESPGESPRYSYKRARGGKKAQRKRTGCRPATPRLEWPFPLCSALLAFPCLLTGDSAPMAFCIFARDELGPRTDDGAPGLL